MLLEVKEQQVQQVLSSQERVVVTTEEGRLLLGQCFINDSLGIFDNYLIFDIRVKVGIPDSPAWTAGPRCLPVTRHSKVHDFLLFSHFAGWLGVASRNKSTHQFRNQLVL